MKNSKIELGAQTLVHEGRFLSYLHQEFIGINGKVGNYEMIVRNKVNDIIAVLPVTSDNKVILIKQFRIPLARDVIEVPAGLGDKPNENPLAILDRELKEEVGYESDNAIFCFESPTSSGLTNETCKCYIAFDCKKVTEELAHEGAEQIEVLEFDLDNIFEELDKLNQQGFMIGSKVYGLLFWLDKLKKK
ncbi:NUDIX hydrolase [Candidatus Gracilibacteria bacterium]|nr:NUDIX hydrolase [Candidatus Gracilibacteria bacterium]